MDTAEHLAAADMLDVYAAGASDCVRAPAPNAELLARVMRLLQRPSHSSPTARRLSGAARAVKHPCLTVLFADVVGFTNLCESVEIVDVRSYRPPARRPIAWLCAHCR